MNLVIRKSADCEIQRLESVLMSAQLFKNGMENHSNVLYFVNHCKKKTGVGINDINTDFSFSSLRFQPLSLSALQLMRSAFSRPLEEMGVRNAVAQV